MEEKELNPKTPDKSKALPTPLTDVEFDQFLRKVTRPIEPKSQSEKEKPQT